MTDEKKFDLIPEAATVVEIKKSIPPDAATVLENQTPAPSKPPGVITGVLQYATEALPSIDVPPHAARQLERSPTPTPSPTETTAPRIGEYALIARFPSSSAADVFLGYKVAQFGYIRRAVVKWTGSDREDFRMRRQSLLDEARAISFVDHPNIVTLLDVADTSSGTYFAVEYVAGTDLRRVLTTLAEREERLPFELSCFLACEVLRGLEYVHTARGADGQPLDIVHRDVNPSNVLVSEDGHVKLTDFGTVLMQGRMQDATAPGMVKGKVRYLAPEYIADQTCTKSVDLYSVGAMLFEMVTGRPCFSGNTNASIMMRIVRDGLPYQELVDANVPEGLASIVMRATARHADERYPTATDLVHALESYLLESSAFVSPSTLGTYLHAHALFV
ncbi:MAG: serine/threonine-protein kinase [Deltaproteobacteria bacterium]